MGNIYDYINDIYIFPKNVGRGAIGVLSNQGANPQAPYYDDLYIQELDTGADTFQFSTVSNRYTQDLLEIGNVVGFHYNNRFEFFTITSLEYSHYEGYKTIGVYAEGIGFELLDIFMEKPKVKEEEDKPGMDNDNDGDDNYDDEYADPDDVYIDADGNIIYDKNGGTDYANPEDVTIDGDGNIIYKRGSSKKKDNDSLEFKNISYPTFLNIVLKNTGWKIVCQPGLESVKHNISVRYDTNIYAILQDSMQAYRGVELEFVFEGISKKDPNGETYTTPVNKVIKAYKDGGRGSFVGKRFEYGRNVSGITKTQEVTQNKEDSVIYIDNIGVDVYYDINFALKSVEIPEIEIGDTHYVIDNDFCPPMTIKARIGRIEVSFSDPTKNKITVANTKKILGSVVDDDDVNNAVKNIDDAVTDAMDDYVFDEMNIEDYIDDYLGDIIGGNSELSKYIEIIDAGHEFDDIVEDFGVQIHMKRAVYCNGPLHFTNEMANEIGAATNHYSSIQGLAQLYTNFVNCDCVRSQTEDPIKILDVDYIEFSSGAKLTSTGSGGTIYADYGEIEELCTAVIRTYPDNPMGEDYVEFRSNIRMLDYDIECKKLTQSSDKSMKENIRYIDDLVKLTDDDLLDKADLHDFIVNQVNLCEYNFIGDTSNKIGFIANDYEGTKVGDKIVSRNGENNTFTYSPDNLLFATIGALQEEVRMRDAQIASLEARLAAIEEMLNNK